jgi:hypothetical protein
MINDGQLSAAVAALRHEQITAETVRLAADGASQLIRYLNHATLSWAAPAALPLPADTTRLIGALHEIAQHLNQTVGQAGDRIAAVGKDSEEARQALSKLRSAGESLKEATGHLSRAHAAAAQISG